MWYAHLHLCLCSLYLFSIVNLLCIEILAKSSIVVWNWDAAGLASNAVGNLKQVLFRVEPQSS